MSHYMLKHLAQDRASDKFRGFSYRKTIVDSERLNFFTKSGTLEKRTVRSKVIAWDIFYNHEKLATRDTLEEVKFFITQEANK